MQERDIAAAAAARGRLGTPMGSVDELVARLGRGKELKLATTWPGGTLAIEIQVLTAAEREQARQAAVKVLKDRGVEVGKIEPLIIELTATEVIHQMLALAVLDPATGAPLFPSCELLAKVATEDELEALFHLFSDHRASVDPDFRAISDEEFAEIDEAVKKKEATRLSSIARSMPRRSLLTLVDRLTTSLTASSTFTSDSPPAPLISPPLFLPDPAGAPESAAAPPAQ